MTVGIPLDRPIFVWDGAFAQGMSRRRIMRCEVLIRRTNLRTLKYGKIVDGLLYTVDIPDWKRFWDDSNLGGPGRVAAIVGHQDTAVDEVNDLLNDSTVRPTLLSPGLYKFWVDYWMFDTQAQGVDRQTQLLGEPVDNTHHHLAGKRWIPPEVPRRGWAQVDIPRIPAGATQPTTVPLTRRRYAFFPELMDLMTWLRHWLDRVEDRLQTLITARQHLESMSRLLSGTINASSTLTNVFNLLAGGGGTTSTTRTAGFHYARMLITVNQILEASGAFLFEDRLAKSFVRNANARAKEIFEFLTADTTFLNDLFASEQADVNSDQVRQILATAQVLLAKTPPLVRKLEVGTSTLTGVPSVTFNAGGSVTGFRNIQGIILARLKLPGSPVRVRVYVQTQWWVQKYFDQVIKPSLVALASSTSGSTVVALKSLGPLFAAKENLPRILIAFQACMSRTDLAQNTGTVLSVLHLDQVLSSTVTVAVLKTTLTLTGTIESLIGQRLGSITDIPLGKSYGAVVLISGVTTLIKTIEMKEQWESHRPASARDYAAMAQAGLGIISGATSIAEYFASQSTVWKGLAGKLKRGGSIFGAVEDTIDLVLYIQEAVARTPTGLYQQDFEDRLDVYSGFIGAGKVIGTVGSYILCTKIAAPIGLIVKAVGFTVSGATMIIQEIDRLGERAETIIKTAWAALDGASDGLKKVYVDHFEGVGFVAWNTVETSITGLSTSGGAVGAVFGLDRWEAVPADVLTALQGGTQVQDAPTTI